MVKKKNLNKPWRVVHEDDTPESLRTFRNVWAVLDARGKIVCEGGLSLRNAEEIVDAVNGRGTNGQ